MSSKTAKRPQPRHDDIDNYNLGELSDSDPFASPSPPSKKPKTSTSAKPAASNNLGIDEEISVAKRARVPNVKLDEDRLLSAAGIPKLRSRAGNLKLKGKGHEWGDAERLLGFYQNWLHDLFPKARFVDALGMVEKAGHKRRMVAARGEWIEEGRRRILGTDKEGVDEMMPVGEAEALRTGDNDGESKRGGGVEGSRRPATPTAGDDVPGDDDLYDATPKRSGRTVPVVNEPDEDDLEALMAEAEGADAPRKEPDASRKTSEAKESDGDDLEALMAEAESHDAGKDKPTEKGRTEEDFAAEEAAMQEMDGLW